MAENVLALCFYVFSYLALYLHLSVITCLALQHCLHHRTAPPQASEPEFFSSWKKGFLESFCEKSVKSDGVDHSQRIMECGIRIICLSSFLSVLRNWKVFKHFPWLIQLLWAPAMKSCVIVFTHISISFLGLLVIIQTYTWGWNYFSWLTSSDVTIGHKLISWSVVKCLGMRCNFKRRFAKSDVSQDWEGMTISTAGIIQ